MGVGCICAPFDWAVLGVGVLGVVCERCDSFLSRAAAYWRRRAWAARRAVLWRCVLAVRRRRRSVAVLGVPVRDWAVRVWDWAVLAAAAFSVWRWRRAARSNTAV